MECTLQQRKRIDSPLVTSRAAVTATHPRAAGQYGERTAQQLLLSLLALRVCTRMNGPNAGVREPRLP